MKKITLVLLVSSVSLGAAAQNTYLDYGLAFKVYNVTSYVQRTYSTQVTSVDGQTEEIKTRQRDWQYFSPAVAVQWKTKQKDFHEVEISDLRVNQRKNISINGSEAFPFPQDPYDRFSSSLQLRYEYILTFVKKKMSRVVPALGFGINPYMAVTRNVPRDAMAFKSREIEAGSRFCITPRLTVHISNRFYAELNIPVGILQTQYTETYSENPTLPLEARKYSRVDFDAFPLRFTGRLGVGVKI